MLRKIKVLHISQATGGVQRHVITLLERLNREKFEITCICPPRDLIRGVSLDKESFLEALKRINVLAYAVEMTREINPFADLAAFFKIYNFIREKGFEVVHTHSSKAGALGRIAARLAGVPAVVHTPHSFAFDRPARMVLSRVFYAAIERFAGLFCDKVLAVCRDEKDLAVRWGVLPAEKIAIISNAISVPEGRVAPDVSGKKKELGLDDSERLVVSVGRLAAQKSPRDFVLAAEKVLEAKKDVKFLFLGDGPLGDATEKLIREKGLTGKLRLLGWRNDSAQIIAASDIFVLSSLWEVLPNFSLLDAMAQGKPVVTTATCGARDLVSDGLNGYVAAVGDYRAIADAVIKLLNLPAEKLQDFGAQSRRIFEKRPTAEDMAKAVENIYLEILCGEGKNAG